MVRPTTIIHKKNLAELGTFNEILTQFEIDHCWQWAWLNYKNVLYALIKDLNLTHILEIGGGRDPLFSRNESEQLSFHYTVNDISHKELDLAPEFVNKACFDISTKSLAAREYDQYDLVFSKMVFEHVTDAKAAYSNCYHLLKKNGVALHFFPTLYSPPMVINKIFPEALTKKVLQYFVKTRNENEIPKFPAYYDWAYSTPWLEKQLLNLGFCEVKILPFYGHDYFEKILLLNFVDKKFTQFIKKRNIHLFSSSAIVLLRK